MKLDLNFNALTKLKDWWKQVQNNFKTIEDECTKTRELADNACTKEQAQSYVAEFAGSSGEYMAAIQAFNELYKQSGSSTEALETLFGERVKKKDFNNHTSNSEIHHTHTNKAVLDEITSESVNEWNSNPGMVFGTYTGDNTVDRVINLGFTPAAVEVYYESGVQGYLDNGGRYIYGGFAMTGKPCGLEYNGERLNAIEIVEGGFKVNYKTLAATIFARTNDKDDIYYFKAYKNCEILEV